MSRTVSVGEAQASLEALIDEVNAGEDVVIARSGQPVARLVAFRTPTKPRNPGLWRGKITIASDFDEPDEALLEMFDPSPRRPVT